MMMVHHDNHRRPFSSSERGDAADGPTCNSNRPPPVSNDNNTYDIVTGVAAAGSSGAGAVLRALQPFDISNRTNITPTTTTTAHHTAFRSPGGMTTYLGFPFTNAQWKELERQAMIYKYMVASVPVPRDLLFPVTRGPSGPAISQSPLSSGFNLRLSNSTDPEPGRCKRTDGKKWRCSRDVAPDQKYCERHMHRGRPRSRKHVEVHATTTTKRVRHDNHAVPTISPATAMSNISNPPISKNGFPAQFFGSTLQPYHDSPVFLDKDDVKVATFGSMTSASSDREPRSLEWMMKGEPVPMATSDQQWHHLMQSKTEVSSKYPFFDANSSVFSQRSEEESFLNLNSYTHFNAGEDQQDTECNLFLNPDVVSLENPLLEEPPSRSFIDAWSKAVIDDKDNSSAPSSGQLSPSSLTLSMGGYNSINDEMGQTQMSLGSNGSNIKPRLSTTWLTPASWVASPPGGPLAEVLKPSSLTLTATTSTTSNPSSPINGNGDLSSPLTTTVSSPSGVLQKTLASMSDSSGCSSPTLATSRAKPAETVALWLDQRKA